MSIITRRGDDGQTDLLFGRRILKSSPRLEAYGTVDELNAVLGVVRCQAIDERTMASICGVQGRLVGMMGELATLEEDLGKYDDKGYVRITETDVEWIEAQAHGLEQECDIRFKGWATPGQDGPVSAAHLDVARTVCRRAERRVATLRELGDLSNLNTALFLNRLSDLLWVLARYESLKKNEQ